MKAKVFLKMCFVQFLFAKLTFLHMCSCGVSDPSDSLPLFGSPEQNFVIDDVNFVNMSDFIDSEASFSNKTEAKKEFVIRNIFPRIQQQRDNLTEFETSDSETADPSSEVGFDSEFDYRADNETDFSWLADYNISELEPSELFFPNGCGPGFWTVFDNREQIVDPAHHRRPPSCILARMLVSIELPDVLELSDWSAALNSTTNRTLWVPKNAIASNQTCEHDRQILTLTWNHTLNGHIIDRINLTLSFNDSVTENVENNHLAQVTIAVYHKERTTENGMKDFVIEASRDVRLMEAPKLFAFCCKESIDVPMNGTITYFGLDSAEHVESLHLTVAFDELCVETFREARYYDELTHLEYNCINGWPYHLVPETVFAGLILFSVFIIVAFAAKYRSRKREMIEAEKSQRRTSFSARH